MGPGASGTCKRNFVYKLRVGLFCAGCPGLWSALARRSSTPRFTRDASLPPCSGFSLVVPLRCSQGVPSLGETSGTLWETLGTPRGCLGKPWERLERPRGRLEETLGTPLRRLDETTWTPLGRTSSGNASGRPNMAKSTRASEAP